MSRAKKQPWRCKQRDGRSRCENKAVGEHGLCRRHYAEWRAKVKHQSPAQEAHAKKLGAAKFTHGIYAREWTEAERESAEQIRGATLQDELDDCRIKLLRITRYIARLEAGEIVANGTDVTNEADGVQRGPDGQPTGNAANLKVVRRTANLSLVDAYSLSDKYTARVAHLERELREGARPADDPTEHAQAMMLRLQGMWSITGGEIGTAAYEPDPDAPADDPASHGNGNGQH